MLEHHFNKTNKEIHRFISISCLFPCFGAISLKFSRMFPKHFEVSWTFFLTFQKIFSFSLKFAQNFVKIFSKLFRYIGVEGDGTNEHRMVHFSSLLRSHFRYQSRMKILRQKQTQKNYGWNSWGCLTQGVGRRFWRRVKNSGSGEFGILLLLPDSPFPVSHDGMA